MCASCHETGDSSDCGDFSCNVCGVNAKAIEKSLKTLPTAITSSGNIADTNTVTVKSEPKPSGKTYESLMAELVKTAPWLSLRDAHEAITAELAELATSWTLTPLTTKEGKDNWNGEKIVSHTYKHSDLVKWTLMQSDIMELAKNKKIHAIKEVRVRTKCGLKEAKEAVEAAWNQFALSA